MSMTDLARANGIRVVLASITPVCDCTTVQTDLRPQGRIADLNGWLKGYAAASGSVYLDYYAALVEGRNLAEGIHDGRTPSERRGIRRDGAARGTGDCGGTQVNW